MRRLTLILLAALPALASAAVARAGEPVALREQPSSHGGFVTLGDLFDGAEGAAAGVVAGRAAQAAGLQAVLDADRVQAIARGAGLDWDNPRGQRRIIVTSDGAAPAAAVARRARSAASRHSRLQQTLVYARNLSAGEIVAAGDLVWSRDAVAAADTPGDPDLAIGKAARRPLREGAAVETHDLASPIAMRRNDSVEVAFESGGITLTLQAKAMNDGAIGDAVQVVNPQSKKVIEAVVSGPGRAVVGPQAEAIKDAAFGPSFRTAAIP